MIATRLFWGLYSLTFIIAYSCSLRLKPRLRILPEKRSRVPGVAGSGEDQDPAHKKAKTATSTHRLPLASMTNKAWNHLPNTPFFKRLQGQLCKEPDNLLSQTIIKKLDALQRLKIPYTFLSSVLKKCTKPDACDALLNTILVKCDNSGYTIAPKLQQILKNNTKITTLSSILNGASNKGAQACARLINKLTERKILKKINELREIGFTMSNLSSILHRSSSHRAVEACQALINRLTEKKMLSQLNQLQKLGFTINNITSMLNGSGNNAAQASESLINKLTEEKILSQLNQLQKLGFTINNLASMLNGSGNNAAQAWEKLLNRLTEKKMLNQLNQLQKLGFTINNLANMLNRSGNNAAQAWGALVSRLTEQEILGKLSELQKIGVKVSHLVAVLRGSPNKICSSLVYIIDLLNNKDYIDTIKKVTTHMYSRPSVMDPNDEILLSIRASKVLKTIGDLRKIPLVSDPSHDKAFKDFLAKCYIKDKHVDDLLLEVKKVADDDPRIALRGQDKVVAKDKIKKGTILGIYTGILLCDQDPIDHAVELAYLATKNLYGVNKLNSYSFAMNLGSEQPLYLSGYGRGNMLMKINASTTHEPKNSAHKSATANVAPLLHSCDGETPFILFHATKDIAPDKELLFDYGKKYWSNHNNNHALSNPDAPIYNNLLNEKKFVKQDETIRFLKLIQKHNQALYQNLLKHIKVPCTLIKGKDRVVECRRIYPPGTAKDYRIYKLPGEPAMGEATKSYFSIKWDPSAGLEVLDKYV